MAINNVLLNGNFSAVRTGVISQIPGSCLGFYYPRTDGISGSSVIDLSPHGNNATLNGAPTIGAGYMTCGAPSLGQYALTPVIDPGADITLIVAARTSDTLAAAGNAPHYITNVGADSQGVTGNHGAEILIYYVGSTPTAANMQGNDYYNNAGASAVTRANLVLATPGTFKLFALTIATVAGVTTRTFYNLTDGTSVVAGSTAARVFNNAIPWRFGGTLSTVAGGLADTAHVSIYGAALSPTTQLTGTSGVVASIRANLLAKGITV